MRLSPLFSSLLVIASLAVLGCSKSGSSSSAAATTGSESPKSSNDNATSAPLVLARGIRFAKPGSGDVAAIVRAEKERATADGRDLVVYVGAKWCEPCQRFHRTAERGELDGDFPELTILEFDLDEDRERLLDAGYSSKLIPLFVVPGPDGRATDRRFEGGVKGDGAATNIAQRLRKLLAT